MSHHAIRLRRDTSATAQSPAAPPPPLISELPGTSQFFTWHGHRVHYRRFGAGPSVLLVHMPDVGASCLEWRQNVEALGSCMSVYAVDLPGYGLSDARPNPYHASDYIQFLSDFLFNVVGPEARVVGSGLGASYLAHLAYERRGLIERLLLVAPCGISTHRPPALAGLAYGMLQAPLVGAALTDRVTSRSAIQEHLQEDVYSNELFAGPQLVEAHYWVSHRPNAPYVERSRLSGLLNVDIRGVIPKVRQRMHLAWGRLAAKPPLQDAETIREIRPDTALTVFDRSALCPHEEEPERFNRLAEEFLCAPAIPMAA